MECTPFPYFSSLPSAPRAKNPGTNVRLRSGIPRLDRFFEGGFLGGQLSLVEGPVDFMLQLTARFAVNGVAAFGRPVLFIDGGNTADPYGLASVCRRWHLDARSVLSQILIARAFTVYQMDTLLSQMVEERVSELAPAVVIVSSLNSMYLDPDVNWDEARVIFENDLGALRGLTEKYGVVTLITNLGRHKSYHAMELGRTLRGAIWEHIDIRARSRHLLHLVRNGAETMDFRPLPAYQCSLDEFYTEGVMTDG
jgi:hypothetical protein